MTTPKYFTIEELIGFIDEPNRTACMNILTENRALFERVRGSTHNHQTWDGGFIDHTTDVMNYAYHLYDFNASFGRPLPFTKSDGILIMFLHDLEKPWRIEVMPDGTVRNRPGLDTKAAFKQFREDKLAQYNLKLDKNQLNGLTYVEGEISHYSSTHRVMNELAAFCHQCDNWSARGWYGYPLAHNDPWVGADKVRTVKQ
jgi:hypothetical protein